MRKNCTNQQKILEIETFFRGGGGETRFYGLVDVSDIFYFFCSGEGRGEQGEGGGGSVCY